MIKKLYKSLAVYFIAHWIKHNNSEHEIDKFYVIKNGCVYKVRLSYSRWGETK